LLFKNLDAVLQNLQLRRRAGLVSRYPIKTVTKLFNLAPYTLDLSPHVIHGRFCIGELRAQRVPISLHVLKICLGRTATAPESGEGDDEQHKRCGSHWYSRRIEVGVNG
jgi:hypothetical protein